MMVAEDLKDLIKSRMDTEQPDNSISAQLVFGTALKDYLEENCEINYSWIAVDPGGIPDPQITFICNPAWIYFPLAPVPNFNAWVLSLSLIIQTSLFEVIQEPAEIPFTLTPLTFGIIPIVAVQSGLSDPDEAILDICDKIIDGIKLMINVTPATGTHGVYIGSATMTLIK